tara:strand:- start:26056 stop:31380 length:5325 start_codon:yes stop_codon:yes gene_type:complete
MAEKKQQQGPPSTSFNTFLKGMNKDVAKYILPPDTYYDGSNIRIAPHHSKEGAAVVNVEGNEFLTEIPCSPRVIALEMKDQVALGTYWEVTSWTVVCSIYTTAQTFTKTFSGTGGNIVSVIYQSLISDSPGFAMNGVVFGNGALPDNIKFTYDNSRFRLTFWSENDQDTYLITNAMISNNYTNTINVGGKNCDLEIIGYTTIRDDIYLFTTNYDGGTPEAIGGSGQIWRLQYDVSTYEITWKCVYNNNLVNFTKQHPIQAIGRYENKDEQGVYWTDNFNPPRKLNVAAEDSIAIDAKFLDLAPVTEFQIPLLNEVTVGGTLPAGTYQIAYRYKSFEGLTSNWSPLSNKVSIYGDEETDPYCNIEGGEIDLDAADLPGTNTSKRIQWNLKDIDTTYDLIEFGAVYMKTSGYDPLLHQYYIFSVASNVLEDISVELTGSEEKVQLSPTEFQEGIGATFERVKTIASRDNKLFMGNITNTSFFVDFDSRAFRFTSKDPIARLDSESDVTAFINGNALYTPPDGSQFTALDLISETHDCINPYNDENPDTNPDWYANDQYAYQANGNILGGTGPNISYKFTTQPLKGDDAQLTSVQYFNFVGDVSGYNGWSFSVQDWFVNSDCQYYTPPPLESCLVNPNETTGVTEYLGIPGQTYNQQGTIENFKSSYQYSLFEGYARGEVYRFGIVFYNSKGAPSFVNWIGDIKFPFDYQHNEGHAMGQFAVHKWEGEGQFKPWMDNNNFGFKGEMWLQSLGIEFTVDLSSIDTKALGITGYSIVRCERKESDKSRFGHALSWGVDHVRLRSEGRRVFHEGNTGWPGYEFMIPHGIVPHGGFGCAVHGLLSHDPGIDNYDIAIYNDSGGCYNVKMIEQKSMMLYGPLNWVNSTTDQLYNRDYKIDFIGGDYLKIVSVFCPITNGAYASLPQWDPSGSGSIFNMNDQPSGQWYKYYYPVTMGAGTGWSPDVGYSNGLPQQGNSQNPEFLKIPLEYSSWVGDGQILSKEEDVAMPHPFVNVTNLPDFIWSFDGDDSYCACNRPRTIGSEGMFALTKDVIPYNTMLMGPKANDSGAGTPARSVISYERYVKPYGGPTHAERSRSIYIMANHYYPISNIQQQIPELLVDTTSTVFGGDVSVNLVDFTQMEKNWGQFNEWWNKWAAVGLGGDPNELTDDSLFGMMKGCVYPAEVHTANPEIRRGYHFASKGGANNPYPDDGTFLHDEYRILDGYMAITNVRSYIPQPLDFNINEEFDTRVYYSNTKTNGESSDSWAVFKVGNFHDVEGIQGPLNNLLVHQDKMYFFQDKGFGVLNINPNAIVQAADGQAIQLGTVSSGTGAFIQSYQYISNQFGASQQWAITKSQSSVYFFDALQKKLFRFDANGMAPLTDITGLSSWFQDKLKGDVVKFDNPILKTGVTSTFDNRHNEALFTFHDKNVNQLYQTQLIQLIPTLFQTGIIMILRALDQCNDCFHMDCPEIINAGHSGDPIFEDMDWPTPDVWVNGEYMGPATILGFVGCLGFVQPGQGLQYGDMIVILPYFQITDFNVDVYTNPIIEMECPIGSASYTIAFNEFVGGFTSFYDFNPSIYVNDGKVMITPNSENLCYNSMDYWNQEYLKDRLYIHDVGSYGTFYDVTLASGLSLISNEASVMTKSFDNISFHMESIAVDGEPTTDDFDVRFDVFNKIRFRTDYQTSGWVETNTGDYYGDRNIRKVEREWQMSVSRNVMSDNPANMDLFDPTNYDLDRQFKERLRDKYMIIDLQYDNLNSITGVAKNVKFILHYFRTFFRGSSR